MPDFELPSGILGWIVSIFAAMIGFISGGVAIKLARSVLG